MPAQGDETARLRALHESYVWEVNAAVAAGREDLAWELADRYLEEAVTLMSTVRAGACERVNCGFCGPPASFRPRHVAHRSWWQRLLG